ncbi:molybdopterin molybdotransferase MoeA [Robiginitalea sp. SC105]|uniref:molybdopterin molybdotransferase MoeA n=1 Tax=Robiginitalea sp. SC105 TaxID=2762332 RepID=UPI001639D846|nr:molybdopterin molybdotransferase MoeA [Robiginitalea sp. SC105]MBC2840560.1 molybdopterin molybdotransferase MoeA [Robiginitalea sp. SC105]
MISSKEALQIVTGRKTNPGKESIDLADACGRYLAQPVYADRPLPPYDRATMDGIAIRHGDFRDGIREFSVLGMARAGESGQRLEGRNGCIEIATGAVVPEGADTVIRYEDLEKSEKGFRILSEPKPGQSIHPAGSDAPEGELLLREGCRIGPAEIAVLASVGIHRPQVFRLPVIILVSTGDELVEVDQRPEPHQIRKSNTWSLRAALEEFKIQPRLLHLADNADSIRNSLEKALSEADVLMLSGGVSKGKFDLIPEALEQLGVRKLFHRVAQRPGKPFWFGASEKKDCVVFSFPGNPVSTFLNYHLYFRDWLLSGMGVVPGSHQARLAAATVNTSELTQFRLVKLKTEAGTLWAEEIPMNSSGDFLSLARAEGFIRLEPAAEPYEEGTLVPLLPFKTELT